MNETVLALPDKIWFPPANVIYHFRKLESEGKINPSVLGFKKAKEAFITAVATAGITKLKERDFWMQIVGDEEGSPDTRTGCYDKIKRDNDFSYQDVEVVTLDSNSGPDLIDFMLKTKLSKNKAYDDKTTILCHVEKLTKLPSWEALNQALVARNLKTQSPIVVIGRADPTAEIYSMAQIYPTVDLVLTRFDAVEECKRRPLKILKLHRSGKGTIETEYHPEEKHLPFEKLNIR